MFGKPLTRETAAELIASGELAGARCSVVWNVGDRPLVQPVADLSVPPGVGIQPVRRIGTYQQATHSIAMYPVLRDGYALMLSVESRLELAWLQQLDFDARVSAIYAQPFALVWKHEAGTLVRIPDLAAVIEGRLVVFEVKPNHRMADPWTRMCLDFTAHTLTKTGCPFRVCGDLSAQRRHNLLILARYRWPNPFVASEVVAVRSARPTTVGGAIDVVERLRGRRGASDDATGCRLEWSSAIVAIEVAKHLIASGACWADLDKPLSIGTGLEWVDSTWRIEWAA